LNDFALLSAALRLYSLLIFVRAIGSFFIRDWSHGVPRVLWDFTEPVLAPVRRILPPMAGLDFSAVVVLILLQVVSGQFDNLARG
jgi:YggT family protein